MKLFFSEFKKDYTSYTFGYAVYALQEDRDRLSDIYAKGFLPYAGASEYEVDQPVKEIYYLARSLRIDLSRFSISSENRRVNRKAEPFHVKLDVSPKTKFTNDTEFSKFCQSYAGERFKGGHMDSKRWDYVLSRNCGSHVFTFRINEKVVGYVLAGVDEKMIHFWYSFFDTVYMEQFPIGKYIMLKTIEWAHANDKKHIYLGTCYGPHSLYKARDFKGTEFFDGASWNSDIATLKSWCKNEDEELTRDRYKM